MSWHNEQKNVLLVAYSESVKETCDLCPSRRRISGCVSLLGRILMKCSVRQRVKTSRFDHLLSDMAASVPGVLRFKRSGFNLCPENTKNGGIDAPLAHSQPIIVTV
ncbi:hypothetical protein DPMN_109062 [Dreissena polymorpha]|uniref:Uncharacterized protein n=1 Tax=Dreissena polymorpha TaxID=45954 RepID=A0A9D4K9L8_DREPO|nr:hypothetical protein DPMN_109062 [Dreissena polymorpha]